MKSRLLIVALCIASAGCQSVQTTLGLKQESRPQLFAGMGASHREVTKNAEAQKYFDQGLTFSHAFNHDEAIRSFTEAARLEPTLAAAWWGVALCNGPHINNPAMDEGRSKAAWEALQKARSLAANATPVERALIDALGARYADPGAGKLPLSPEERAPLDRAYADAMKKVYEKFPKDADVGSLYAESMMDLRPWDLHDLDGTPRPETPEIIRVLEATLALAPNHPGANHLYIHTMEASRQPERAVPAADRLTTLVPAAGHLVHMPAHIYARVGRWEDAAKSNRAAIVADAAYRKLSPTQGFYHIYMAHNHGFLAWGSTMQGRSEEAIRAARDMVAGVPQAFIDQMAPVIDGYLPITLEVLMRFGKWEEILKERRPQKELVVCNAMWHCTRAIAYANTERMAQAEAEFAEFKTWAAKVPADQHVGNSPARTVMTIAEHMIQGEMAYRRGSIDDAVKHLTTAVAAEDTLRYDEPPDWMQPVRHTLGAVLVSAGRWDEAEAVYRADLKKWPENGWALFGLSQCLKQKGSPEAAAIEARFQKAWALADIKIGASCLCVNKSGGK